MKLKSMSAVGISLLLAACIGSSMNTGLQSLSNKPAREAFDRLGYPTEDRVIAGRRVYIWSTNHMGPAIAGNRDVQYQCTIRIFVDERDIITGGDWEGNGYGCSQYLSRLRG